jgi:hypothetical protein
MSSFLTQIRFPTLFGIALLIVGLGTGVYLTVREQSLISQATPDQTPLDIKITNIEAQSVAISWRTNTEVAGFISYGQSGVGENIALDIRDKTQPQPHKLHYVVLNNLTPATSYKYKIVSGKLNDLSEETFATASEIETQSSSKPIIGNVIEKDQPLIEGIVYLEVDGATPQSALVKDFGSFIIPISLMRNTNLSDIFSPNGEVAKLTALTKDNSQGTGTFQLTEDNQLTKAIKIGEDTDLSFTTSDNTLGITTTFSQINNLLNKLK